MTTANGTATEVILACPSCRTPLVEGESGGFRSECGRSFPDVAGFPDLRLRSDRYLDLNAERSKAERLARIAATTDLEGVARAYYAMTHDVDPTRCVRFLRHILRAEQRGAILARRIPTGGTVLDLGCGTGATTLALAARGDDATGVDIASRWLVAARRRLHDAGVDARLIAADAEALPFPDASFDHVVADSLIEHLDDPEQGLREAFRVLRPGGTLLLWSPNRLSPIPDPHVRLWGVGYLPYRWGKAYAARRRGAWLPRCLSTIQARRMIDRVGFGRISVGFPTLDATDASLLAPGAARLVRVGAKLAALPVLDSAASVLGPVWELRARKE